MELKSNGMNRMPFGPKSICLQDMFLNAIGDSDSGINTKVAHQTKAAPTNTINKVRIKMYVVFEKGTLTFIR